MHSMYSVRDLSMHQEEVYKSKTVVPTMSAGLLCFVVEE
jgi:hypothetical protein